MRKSLAAFVLASGALLMSACSPSPVVPADAPINNPDCVGPTRPPQADPSSDQYDEASALGWEAGNRMMQELCEKQHNQ